MWESGLWASGVTRAQGVRVGEEQGLCVAFGAREGSRAWVMEDFVYNAKKLGFYAEGEGSILRELDFLFCFTIFKRYFRKNTPITL